MRARLDAAPARGPRIAELAPGLRRRLGLWATSALPGLFEAGRLRACAHYAWRPADQARQAR